MNSSSGDFLSPQPDTLSTTPINSVTGPLYADDHEVFMPAEDLAQRLQIEELASGNGGKGFAIIFDSPKY